MDGAVSLIFISFCLFVPMLICHLSSPVRKVEIIRYRETFLQAEENLKKNKPAPSIYDDAVSILVEMGMKKPLAKEKVSTMLKKKQYDSIESFLLDVYKR